MRKMQKQNNKNQLSSPNVLIGDPVNNVTMLLDSRFRGNDSWFLGRIMVMMCICLFVFTGMTTGEQGKEVILKVLATNPSETETYTVPLKIYLPKEATPDNVIDKGDLEIDYDIDEGAYFVFKEMELKPGESVTRQIKMEDIWYIKDEQIKKITDEVEEVLGELVDTEYADRASELKEMILTKIETLQTKQDEALDASPADHILAYRENLQLMREIKEDLFILERLLIQTREAIGVTVVRKVSIEGTWMVIMAIIGGLVIISLGCFYVWTKQIRASGVDELVMPSDIAKFNEQQEQVDWKMNAEDIEGMQKKGVKKKA